eukprot:4058479-Ditylum_brightwellii.AAC.1
MMRNLHTTEETLQCLQAALDLASSSNQNLISAQKELMRWYHCLGHINFRQIQWLADVGKFPAKNPKAVDDCQIPVCASCQFAKQKKTPSKAAKLEHIPEKEMEINGKVFAFHQKSQSTSDSIKSILKLVREATESGIKVQACHTDNGTFLSNNFMSHLANKKQPIRFIGFEAAHQNAVAKRAIQTITYMARIMLIHAPMRSPSGAIT